MEISENVLGAVVSYTGGIPTPTLTAEAIEKALMAGDFSKMDAPTRVTYYLAVCQSAGLNPMTRPFIPLKTQTGEVILYATRECAEQLRSRHRVSLRLISREKFDGLYCVTVEGRLPDGRSEEAQGIVDIASLKGQALGNALMRAESKAKRRVTLALCGLGFDLADLADLADRRALPFNPHTGELASDEIILHGGQETMTPLAVHLADVFGDDTRGSTMQAPPALDVESEECRNEEIRSLDSERVLDYPDANQRHTGSSSAWRDTLEAHKDDSALSEGLRSKVRLALNPASETTDVKGLALAGAVLDTLNAQHH